MNYYRATEQKHPKSVHSACHMAHIDVWPIGAKVFVPWGVQGWVPGVIIGKTKTRNIVKIVGRAQSGMCMDRFKTCRRTSNNIRARKDWGVFPASGEQLSCVRMSAFPGGAKG